MLHLLCCSILLSITGEVLTNCCLILADCSVLYVVQWITLRHLFTVKAVNCAALHTKDSSVFSKKQLCVCETKHQYACVCEQLRSIHAEPAYATWWLVFAKTLSHVSLSDTPFEKHTEIQYINEVALHTLMHHHMYINRSIFKYTVTGCNWYSCQFWAECDKLATFPQRCISSFTLIHFKTPQDNWPTGTTGLTHQEPLWLCVSLSL